MKILIIVLLLSAASVFGQNAHYKLPLKISGDKRHLTDQKGKYFLYNGDTGWMLFLKLNRDETLDYLIQRKSLGFNVIQVQLTGFAQWNGKPPVNRDGQKPFLKDDDFSTANPRYYDHVEWVLKQADSLGLVMAIAPLWAGCCGEGWAGKGKHMEVNRPAGNFTFGEYLGKRFGRYKHLLWIMGGDSDPAQDAENYRQLALGIKKYAPAQLITYHASSTHSSTDIFPAEHWLDLSMVYTYFRGFNKAWIKDQPDVYEASWKEYAKSPVKPFILGESTYEGEHGDWGSALQARKQAYWALLGGSTGHAYGSPLWKFETDWKNFLNLPGAISLKHYHMFFSALSWHKLVPDTNSQITESGMGKLASNDYAVTAMASDGSFLVSYLPSPRTITINLNQLKPKSLSAQWFNPLTGKMLPGNKISGKGRQKFQPPSQPHDWVLLIK